MSVDAILKAGWSACQIERSSATSVGWLRVGEPSRDQGWKLHLSSRSDRIFELLERALPVLRACRCAFKVAESAEAARTINSGEAGTTQVGKILTIYPADDDQAVALGAELTAVLRGFPGPAIDNELRLTPDAPVFARYGGFTQRNRVTRLGLRVPFLDGPDGQIVPDLRSDSMHERLGIASPFAGAAPSRIESLLGNRVLVVGPLLRNPRNSLLAGVHLETHDPCVLKSAKRHTALDRSGRDSAERLEREAALLARLESTSTAPRPIDLIQDADRAILVMEQIRGQTLLQYVRQGVRQSSEWQSERIDVAVEVALLVRELHAAGVVHGDVNPANLLVDESGRLRIVDFEFACTIDSESFRPGFATQGYAAPAIRSGGRLGPGHDLYSLAAVFYFLATGIELASVPQSDAILREGTWLREPWRDVVEGLLHADRTTAGAVLESTLERLGGLLVSKPETPFRRLPTGTTGEGLPDFGLPGPSRAAGGLRGDGDESPRRSVSRWEEDIGAEWNAASVRAELQNLAGSLIRRAHRTDMGTWSWTSRHPSTMGETHRNLYMGDAGIALSLLRIGLATERIDLVETAADVAEGLWLQRPTESDGLPGLFMGEAGVGLLFLALAELLGDDAWLRRAVERGRWVAGQEVDSPDLTHGIAGRGLFHVWLYEYTSDRDDLRASLACAEHLVATCRRTEAGPLWPIPDDYGGLSGNAFFGVAHGSAGVGLFLAELMRVEPAHAVVSLAEDVAESLKSAERADGLDGTSDWPDSPGGPCRSGVWCHGSAGIALAFLRFARVLPAHDCLAVATRALRGALSRAHQIGPTLCHGVAGLIEVYLDLWERTGRQQDLTVARQLTLWLLKAFVADDEAGPMICAEKPDVLTGDFMVGCSGSAASVARALEPHRFGHFLRSPREAFRPVFAEPTTRATAGGGDGKPPRSRV